MNRIEALSEIIAHYPEKTAEWAESQLARAESNVDGEVDDYSDILAGEFGIER